MNLQELNEWLKKAKIIDRRNFDTDSCGNNSHQVILEFEGQHFMLESFNNRWSEDFGDKGYIRNSYTPKPVHKVSWMEYRYEWISNKEE